MNSHHHQQKLVQQGNCQYVQLLDYHPSSAAGSGSSRSHGHGSSSHTSSSANIAAASASATSQANLYSFAPFMNMQAPMNRQEYVQQTLSEIVQRPKKTKHKSVKAPFKRQQIPINTVPTKPASGGRGSKNKQIMLREENYNVFIPKKSLTCQQFTAKVECRGCNKQFAGTIISAGSIFGEPNFFIHCVKECVQYRALGLTRKCDECALLFMNSQSERKHHGECHRIKKRKKPIWMADSVYKVRSGIRCNTKVSCTACGQFFGAQNSAGKISYSLDYLIHCIEECVEYQKLDLVQVCPTCNCKFLNRLSLSQHKLKSKH